jgi:N-acetylmuramoyl-L-alanine amidase
MRVCINAGHTPVERIGKDDWDCGAVNKFNGDTENKFNALIARQVQTALNAVGYNTIYIQDYSLEKIADYCNVNDCDYFLSVHCNSFNEQARGTEVLYHPYSPEGLKLAIQIQNQIIATFSLVNRGVKSRSDLYVLNATNCVAVLIECAFIDNASDDTMLHYRFKDFGDAIARGFTDYISKVQ